MTDRSKPLSIAIDPPSLPYNMFVGSFADAVAGATGGVVTKFSDRLSDLLKTDIAILHWPNDFMGLASRRKALWKLAKIALARRFGMKLVWVAHNVAPHEGASKHDIVPKTFLANLDGIIYLSNSSRDIVRARYEIASQMQECVTVHGYYGDPEKSDAFAPPAPYAAVEIANVGQIRPYKNVDELLDAALDPEASGLHLTLSGFAPNPEYAASLQGQIGAQAGTAGNVKLDLRSSALSEEEVETLIDNAHGVALPYKDILNSGSAIFALSRARPVLVPALGSMPELRDMVGAEWVMLYDGDIDGKKLKGFADFIRNEERGARPDLTGLSWGQVTKDLFQFFCRLRSEGKIS